MWSWNALCLDFLLMQPEFTIQVPTGEGTLRVLIFCKIWFFVCVLVQFQTMNHTLLLSVRTLRDDRELHIHPNSVLFGEKPPKWSVCFCTRYTVRQLCCKYGMLFSFISFILEMFGMQRVEITTPIIYTSSHFSAPPMLSTATFKVSLSPLQGCLQWSGADFKVLHARCDCCWVILAGWIGPPLLQAGYGRPKTETLCYTQYVYMHFQTLIMLRSRQ